MAISKMYGRNGEYKVGKYFCFYHCVQYFHKTSRFSCTEILNEIQNPREHFFILLSFSGTITLRLHV